MIVTLIRHAESQSQTQENHDLTNPDLSTAGEAQAAMLAKIPAVKYDEIWVSPLSRTAHTFRLSRFSAPVIKYDSRLLEFWFPEQYFAHFPIELPDVALADTYHAWAKDSEERVESVIQNLKELNMEHICLFTHQAWIRSFLDKLFPEEYPMTGKIEIDNCSRTIVQLNEMKSKVIEMKRLCEK